MRATYCTVETIELQVLRIEVRKFISIYYYPIMLDTNDGENFQMS
jgi:hypothetical protein